MSKKSLLPFLILFSGILFFTGCKKGEEDPALSLRTRKSRVVGRWRLQGGNASVTITKPNKSPYNEGYLFDGVSVTLNVTEPGQALVVYKGSYALNLEFKKDGTFTVTENLDGMILTAKGSWNFLGRVGKDKNKESVVLTIESVTGGITNEHIFTKFGTEFVYSINKLKNKEMDLESATKLFLDSNGETVGYKSEYRLIQ